MTCTGAGTAVAGQYGNLGTATGISPEDVVVEDSDPSHYYSIAVPKTLETPKGDDPTANDLRNFEFLRALRNA